MNPFTRFLLPLLFLHIILLPARVIAQEHGQEANLPDTSSVKNVQELFTKGELHGHVRNYFMATLNHRSLSDHYANALGAEIGVRTASFHGFRLGISGIFTYNLFSSHLDQKDPIAGKYPSNEGELFDIENPHNKDNLDRLESAYLEYRTEKLHVRIGRFDFTSPLINPQDTRMKPYSVQGVMAQVPVGQHTKLTAAWLDHFSPRGVIEWGNTRHTIGLYSNGVNIDGSPSGYRHHIESRGVAAAGLQGQGIQNSQWQAWNYWIENIANTSYGRVVMPISERMKVGLEGLYQFQLGNGGHPAHDSTYFPDQQEWVAGGMVGYSTPQWALSANYLHTGGNGRFTFPREWGREQFFATLSRGRLEGTGQSDILVVKSTRNWSPGLSSELALAKAWLPGYGNAALNKYGAVSYWGTLLDVTYTPLLPALKGVVLRLLYIGKLSPNTSLPLERMYYNTNFHQINFVSQLNF
ncbi:MAG: porin [Rufibacter sp.]